MYYLLAGGASLVALATALIAQYVFDIQPCVMCLYERWAMAGLSLICMVCQFIPRIRPWGWWLALAFALSGVGLTFFHVGMEEKWWPAPAHCSSARPGDIVEKMAGNKDKALTLQDAESFNDALNKQPLVPCDKVSWRIFGVSATVLGAGFFIAMCLLLALV